jgi:predicted porin
MNVSTALNFEQEIKNCTVKMALSSVREKSTMILPIKKLVQSASSYANNPQYEVKREIRLNKDPSYQATSSIKFGNLQIAGGFINNGCINLPTNENETDMINKFGLHLGDSGKIWNIGGKYTVGCVDLSFSLHNAKRAVTGYSTSKGKIATLCIDCQIVSGVKIFAEIDHIKAETDEKVAAIYNTGAPHKNHGTVFMLGSKICF